MRIPVCIPVIPKKAKEYVNAAIDKNLGFVPLSG